MLRDRRGRAATWRGSTVRSPATCSSSAAPTARPAPATVEPRRRRASSSRWPEPQRRVAPGQSVVLYDPTDTYVLGGGTAVLSRRGPWPGFSSNVPPSAVRDAPPAEGVHRGDRRRPAGRIGRAFASVFANPALRRINLANVASVTGDSAYAVAVAVWAYEEGGAARSVCSGCCGTSPWPLLAPLCATLADRHERRLVMIGSDLSSVAVIVIGAVLIAADGPPVAIYAAGLLTGVLSLAFRPAEAAVLPEVASNPRELTSANVVSSTIESVGFFAGPALGAVLLSVADVPIVYLVNALTFVASAAFLVGLRGPTGAPSPTSSRAGRPSRGSASGARPRPGSARSAVAARPPPHPCR